MESASLRIMHSSNSRNRFKIHNKRYDIFKVTILYLLLWEIIKYKTLKNHSLCLLDSCYSQENKQIIWLDKLLKKYSFHRMLLIFNLSYHNLQFNQTISHWINNLNRFINHINNNNKNTNNSILLVNLLILFVLWLHHNSVQ